MKHIRLFGLITILGLGISATSAEQLPIGEGAYLPKEHCDLAERGELDMVRFMVGKNGREVSFEESGCLVAAVNSIRGNRYDVELDCREIDVVYQHRFFLDVITNDHIRVDGDDLWLCKKGFLANYATEADEVDDLIELWDDAHENCAGGQGDDPETKAACIRREQLVEQLNEQGMCFGREGQSRADYEWHACAKGSIK